MDLFVTRAATIAHDVEAADSSRAFRSAVQDFEHLLSRIAHYPSDFLTDGDVHALASIADLVVNRIEDRLAAHADRGKVQVGLVRSIYQLRRHIENIYLVIRAREVAPVARV